LKPLDFIRLARLMVSSQRAKPNQVALRRAVSTAYYALFHTLANCGADQLVGTAGADRSNEAWRQVYRALEHSRANGACKNSSMMSKFPKEIQDFGNSFVTMQAKRHNADYEPTARFAKSEVVEDIKAVAEAIQAFNKTEVKDRRAFAAYVLFKNREKTP